MRRCEHPKKVDQRWNDNFQEMKRTSDEGDSEVPRRGQGEQGEVRGQEQSMHSR